jgi:hypothetical protein
MKRFNSEDKGMELGKCASVKGKDLLFTNDSDKIGIKLHKGGVRALLGGKTGVRVKIKGHEIKLDRGSVFAYLQRHSSCLEQADFDEMKSGEIGRHLQDLESSADAVAQNTLSAPKNRLEIMRDAFSRKIKAVKADRGNPLSEKSRQLSQLEFLLDNIAANPCGDLELILAELSESIDLVHERFKPGDGEPKRAVTVKGREGIVAEKRAFFEDKKSFIGPEVFEFAKGLVDELRSEFIPMPDKIQKRDARGVVCEGSLKLKAGSHLMKAGGTQLKLSIKHPIYRFKNAQFSEMPPGIPCLMMKDEDFITLHNAVHSGALGGDYQSLGNGYTVLWKIPADLNEIDGWELGEITPAVVGDYSLGETGLTSFKTKGSTLPGYGVKVRMDGYPGKAKAAVHNLDLGDGVGPRPMLSSAQVCENFDFDEFGQWGYPKDVNDAAKERMNVLLKELEEMGINAYHCYSQHAIIFTKVEGMEMPLTSEDFVKVLKGDKGAEILEALKRAAPPDRKGTPCEDESKIRLGAHGPDQSKEVNEKALDQWKINFINCYSPGGPGNPAAGAGGAGAGAGGS